MPEFALPGILNFAATDSSAVQTWPLKLPRQARAISRCQPCSETNSQHETYQGMMVVYSSILTKNFQADPQMENQCFPFSTSSLPFYPIPAHGEAPCSEEKGAGRN